MLKASPIPSACSHRRLHLLVTGNSPTPLHKRILRTFLLGAAIYVLACVGCASCQRRMIYFPPVFSSERVDELAKPEKLVRWTSPSGKPLGWRRLAPVQPAQGQVLITHGNADCAFQC